MRQLKITQQVTVRDTASLDKYLQEVSSIQSGGLSAQEECEIAARIQNPKTPGREKQELMDKLTTGNLRFVISVAKQYQRNDILQDLGDLINAGNLGLVKAAERFDHTRGFKFISYAVWWIRQSILEDIAHNGKAVRMPQNKIGLHNKLKRIEATLEQHLERRPTQEEVAWALAHEDDKQAHLTGLDIQEVFVKNRQAFSMDSYVDDTDKDTRYIDSMESDGLSELQSAMRLNDLRFDLGRLLEKLKPIEVQVLRLSFGLDQEPMTLEEVGEAIGKTRERARQIREGGIRKLRNRVKDTTLHEYL